MPAFVTQFLQYAGPLALAIYAVITAFATLFAVLGRIFPGGFGAFCVKAASALGVVGADVQKIINLITPFLGGKKKPAVPPLAVFLIAFVLCLVACTPMGAIVPVTPDNQAQVSSCQSLSSAHNDFVVGGFVVGLSGSTLAGIAAGEAASKPSLGRDLGIAATATGALAAGAVVLSNYYSNGYAAQQCSAVMGPLPLLPAKPKPADPVQVTIVTSPVDAGAGG